MNIILYIALGILVFMNLRLLYLWWHWEMEVRDEMKNREEKRDELRE